MFRSPPNEKTENAKTASSVFYLYSTQSVQKPKKEKTIQKSNRLFFFKQVSFIRSLLISCSEMKAQLSQYPNGMEKTHTPFKRD